MILSIDGVKSTINPGVKYPFNVSDSTKEATIITASGKSQDVNPDVRATIIWIVQDQDLISAKFDTNEYGTSPIGPGSCAQNYSVINSTSQNITIVTEDNTTKAILPQTTFDSSSVGCTITVKLNNGTSYKVIKLYATPIEVDNDGVWYTELVRVPQPWLDLQFLSAHYDQGCQTNRAAHENY